MCLRLCGAYCTPQPQLNILLTKTERGGRLGKDMNANDNACAEFIHYKSRRACEEWESEKTASDLSAGRTREEREVKEQLQR